ncbi:hypothetical protein [Cupriavidus gilardii]|nr:hypothetical protein [Cupriavidus gilardii]NSX05701.1 hypothetical protein [Cupriavidus gilardii]
MRCGIPRYAGTGAAEPRRHDRGNNHGDNHHHNHNNHNNHNEIRKETPP